MGLFSFFKKKENIDPMEARKAFLLEHGRITDGRIIDSIQKSSGEEVVFYIYTLNGVDFESSEILTEEQLANPVLYAPGAKVGVRYDPKNQGNSMLV